MAKCKSCGAEIVWVRTEAGKAMPLDAKPEKRFVLGGTADLFAGSSVASEPTVALVDTYVSHFATCPQADQHRKARS